MPLVAINNLDDPRVAAYRNVKDRDLAQEGDRFIAEGEYLVQEGREFGYRGHHLVTASDGSDGELLTLNIVRNGTPVQLTGRGNGPIDALVHALGLPFDVLSYEEKSMGKGSEAKAAAFVEITTPSRVTLFGVGVHANIITASTWMR